MSGSFDNLPRLQSLDEGEYGKISAGLRPPHSIYTGTDLATQTHPACSRPEAVIGDASRKSFRGVGAGPPRSSFGEAATDARWRDSRKGVAQGGSDAVEGLCARNENLDDRSHVRRVATLARRPFLGLGLGRPRDYRRRSRGQERGRRSRALHSIVLRLPTGWTPGYHERPAYPAPRTRRLAGDPCRSDRSLRTRLE